MRKIILLFLFIGHNAFSQFADAEKRDTMFLVFEAKSHKRITLSKTESRKTVVYKYEYSTDRPVNSIELIADKKRSKVKINREKLWTPREDRGISWFNEDLAHTKVIYVVETVNKKKVIRRVLKVNPRIIMI